MCTINKVHLFYFKKNGTSHAFIDTMGYTHSIKELGSFGYILLLVSLKPSPLSPCVCIKIFSILKKKKKKKKGKRKDTMGNTTQRNTCWQHGINGKFACLGM